MNGTQLGFGIALSVVGLVLLPFARRIGRHMDEESRRLRENAPKVNRIVVGPSNLQSETFAPFALGAFAAFGVVLIVTAFTA